ncbi:MAG: hypothetical protein N2316_04360 [Spirochaetes bacterium]|nr:hypothetical protein [Spirochaetota bacterium]
MSKARWVKIFSFILIFVFVVNAVRDSLFSIAFLSRVYAQDKKDRCHNCDEDKKSKNPICAFTYIALFFWYSMMAIACAVAIVMDLTTGFTQGFTASFIEWFIDSTNKLSRFFRSIGC